MDYFLIGAGKPHSGIIPSFLRKLNDDLTVIDWQLNTINKIKNKISIYLVIGYRNKLVEKKLKNKIKLIIRKQWKNSNIIDTFFSLPLKANDTFISYADTIFNSTVFTEITDNDYDLLVGIDGNWKKRYPNRTTTDLNNAEIISINNKKYEFTGLIFFKKKVIQYIKDIPTKDKNKISNLIDLVLFLKSKKFRIKYYDVRGKWAEFNLEQDVARFFIKGKAETLENLNSLSKEIKIPKQLSFTIKNWEQHKKLIIDQIKSIFKNNTIIIRSSSNNEDTWQSSQAGKFITVKDINPRNRNQIKDSINKVISSYQNIDKSKDSVLVQLQIKNIKISGVIFTCTLDTGAPYYHINFDRNSKITDGVTSGNTNNLEKITVSKYNLKYLENNDKFFYDIIKKVRAIERFLVYSKLDIEFIVTDRNKFILLQVRPITVDHSKYINFSNDLQIILKKQLKANFKNFLYSNMTDWNPAEIIGKYPKSLAANLYEEIITNRVWSIQRYEFGFDDLLNKKLLKFFYGQPYVTVDHSLKSFIPKNLPDYLKKKLLNHYKLKIINDEALHDKVEFDVVFTVWTQNLDLSLQSETLLSQKEIYLFSNQLKIITINALKRLSLDTENFKLLNDNRQKILSSNKNDLIKIKELINSTKKYGTLPFAHAARACFISMYLLKNFVKNKYITKKRMDLFLFSIKTVSKELAEDKIKYKTNNQSLKNLIKKYGHLREGTYEISQNSYEEDPKKYFDTTERINKEIKSFTFKNNEKIHIKKYLSDLGSDISFSSFITYLKKSIELREKIKFEFTKDINEIFKLIKNLKIFKNISRDDLSFINLNDLNKIKDKKISISQIKKNIKIRREIYKTNRLIELPDVIRNKKDLFYFREFKAKPNYITLNKIEADIIKPNNVLFTKLKKFIVIIPNADPGFDWIFSYKIAGLITKYGGANSHMAIRAAELNIPAAIGVGEILYSKILLSKRILLNCENKKINIME